jgi:cleavage stimulation factor subunit 3
VYLDYVRRRNNIVSDSSGAARQVVSQAFDFVLANVGSDRDAGSIWKDYVQFVRSGPGTVGGSTWQDQQKMDSLRKVLQQAIVVPTQDVEPLWRDYYSFETQLNAVLVCRTVLCSTQSLTLI